MKPITSEQELEEILSQPTEADIAAAAHLAGDVILLGAGSKMGFSLARRFRRALDLAGSQDRVMVQGAQAQSSEEGIEVFALDLLEPGALQQLPNAPNVLYMVSRGFGLTGMEHLAWATNAYLPGLVCERFRNSRILALSTVSVYPLLPISYGGASESMPPAPVGEYGQSALARERLFEYGCHRYGTPTTVLRLNNAVDLRYGMLVDICRCVFERRPIDMRLGLVNLIWQGDVNSVCIRAFQHCQCPPLVVNVTGPETVSLKWIAQEFGRRLGVQPLFEYEESALAQLANCTRMVNLFGYPSTGLLQLIEWTTTWLGRGGVLWDTPS